MLEEKDLSPALLFTVVLRDEHGSYLTMEVEARSMQEAIIKADALARTDQSELLIVHEVISTELLH